MATPRTDDFPDEPTIRSDAARLVRRTLGQRRYGALLFGSRARGTAGPDSDWDLAVLLDEAGEARRVRRALKDALATYGSEHGIRLHVVVLDPGTAPKSQPLLRNIDRDGVPL